MKKFQIPKLLNIKEAIEFTKQLHSDYGTKFTLLIISNYFGIKGALNEFNSLVQLYFYQDGNWNSNQYQLYMTIASIPWSIKGIGGILSDIFPIFGYEKSSYFLIYTTLGFTSCLLLGALPMSIDTISGYIPTMCFFFVSLQGSFLDLLCEGKYVELMKQTTENRGNIVSFSYICVSLGTILPTALIGPISTLSETRYLFFIFLPISLQPAIFILTGCMINDKASPERNNRIDFVKLKTKGKPMIMAFSMFVVGLGSVFVGMTGDPLINLLYNLGAGILLSFIAYLTLPLLICKILIYLFMIQSLYVNIDGTLEYFYTSTENCVPNGPQFSRVYYRSVIGFVGILAQLIGIIIFQAVLTHWTYRPIFWVTTLLRCAASLFDIVMINRWNTQIGISDEVMYVFGNAIIYKAAYQLDFLPSALIMAKLCPKNIEVTIFSILAGYANYGLAVARYIGFYLTDSLNIQLSVDGPCEYSNLTLAVIIGHLITPILAIPFTFILIPNRKISDNFVDQIFDHERKINDDVISKNITQKI